MSRMGRGNKRTPDIPLLMECFDDELSPSQLAAYNRCEKEYQEITTKLEGLNKSAEVIERMSDQVYALQTTTVGNAPMPTVNANAATPAAGITKTVNTPLTRQQAALVGQSPPTIVSPGSVLLPPNQQSPAGVVTRGSAANSLHTSPANTYQLVMDPRLGFIVGTVATQSPTTTPVIQSTTSLAGKTTNVLTPPEATLPRMQTQVTPPTTRTGMQQRTRMQTAIAAATTPPSQKPANSPSVAKSGLVSLAPAAPVPRTRGKNVPITPKPAEGNSIGGLSLGGANKSKESSCTVVDLTNDDNPTTKTSNKQPVADSHEVTFSKLSGKTFPSLVVVARPNLRVKDIPQSVASQDRTQLDSKVKNVLMFLATKFTEWLIQQGLVRSEQTCSIHYGTSSSRIKLKLGMYSDASKFPYSGGYVWISDCCPQRFVSVFHGSIFEGAPHPPTVLLKLIYHWCCQTNIQNVVQWVKVDNFYVKNFYSNMRSICTVAVHEKYEKMGGPRKKIEVGVISLGTTSQDGNMRQVKVEVLGVMDAENKLVRLRAIEPLQEGERNYKRRFVKILEPLENWVEKDSIILTDFTVDKGTLHTMGFTQVYQVSVSEASSANNKFSNQNVMEYLRRIVPRMFQNTLSLLSRQIIQQFLDELVWRERWGPIAAQAFDNIILHIAEQTKLDTGESLVTRLSKVAANPFKQWNYAAFPPPSTQPSPITPTAKGDTTSRNVNGASKSTSNTVITMQGDSQPASAEVQPQGTKEAGTVGKRGRKRAAEIPTPAVAPPLKQPKRVATPPQPKAVLPQPKAVPPQPKAVPPQPKAVPPLPKAVPPQPKAVPPQPKAVPTQPKAVPTQPKAVSTQPKAVPTPPPLEEQVCLDSYYYGTVEGNAEKIKNEYKTTLDLKCCVCHRKFMNNITLMKHLLMHMQSNTEFTTELSDLTQCKYCLKSFPTPFSMQTHMEEVHMKVTTTSLVCRICEEKVKDRMSLISHMHKNHVAMEVPYECGVCQFRSSMHKDVVDHFYEVHNGGEKLQCPFCLKIVSIGNHGKKISANVNFFLNHMQKHQRKSITRKCNKCTLWFVHKGILKEHQIKDHISFSGQTGAKAFSVNTTEVMMSLPATYNNNQGRGPMVRKGSPNLRTSYNMKKFEELKIVDVCAGSRCCECEGDMMGEDHFMGYLQCLRCQYSTCCSKAMAEHTVIFHDNSRAPQFNLGRMIQLPKEMFCVCGFKSASGNKLASHLAHCKRKSAYPSPAQAKAATIQSASFPPLVTLDDAEDNASEDPSDRWLKAFVSRKDESENSKDLPEKKTAPQTEGADPPSMLNILGLVRKASTDESSLDRAPSDTEGGPPDSRADAENTTLASQKSDESNNKNDDRMDIEIEVDVDVEVDVEKVDDGAGHDFQTGGCTPDKDDKAFAGFDVDANSASKEADNFGIFSAFNKSSDGEKAAADKTVSSTPVLDEDSASSVMDGVSNLDPDFVQENDTSSVPRESEQVQITNDVNTMVSVGSEVDRSSSLYVTEPEALIHAEKDIVVSPVAESHVTEPESHVHVEKDIDVSPIAQSEVNCTNDNSSFTPSEVVPSVPPHAQLGTGDGGGDSTLTQPAMNAASYQSPADPESNSSDVPAVTEPKAYGDCVAHLAQTDVLRDSEVCNKVGTTIPESGLSQQYDSVAEGAGAMPQCEDDMDVDLEP